MDIANSINTKDVARLLKVNPEIIAFLRKTEGLPYFKQKKYIVYSEEEVVRWRNRRLALDSKIVIHLPTYYLQIGISKYCGYDFFKSEMQKAVFMDGDNVIQYLKRQRVWDNIQDVVGNIITAYWNARKPRCSHCGKVVHSTLKPCLCLKCREKRDRGE